MTTPPLLPAESSLEAAAGRRARLVSDDLLPSLIAQMDASALAMAMRVNHSFNELAGRRLYRTVVLDYSQPFDRCALAGMSGWPIDESEGPEDEGDTWTKRYHMVKHAVTLEIAGHHRAPASGVWESKVGGLALLCPRLEVLRIKAHTGVLPFAYFWIHIERLAVQWTPRVLELVAIRDTEPVNSQGLRLGDLIDEWLADEARTEIHIPVDNAHPAAPLPQIFDAYDQCFGADSPIRFLPSQEESAVYIDIRGGFGSPETHREALGQFVWLFFSGATSIHVTWYLKSISPIDKEQARQTEDTFNRRVQTNSAYNETVHQKRLEGCSFKVAPASQMGQYACVKGHGQGRVIESRDIEERKIQSVIDRLAARESTQNYSTQ